MSYIRFFSIRETDLNFDSSYAIPTFDILRYRALISRIDANFGSIIYPLPSI